MGLPFLDGSLFLMVKMQAYKESCYIWSSGIRAARAVGRYTNY